MLPVRLVAAALVVLCLGLFVAAIPAVYLRLRTPPEAVHASLAQHGVSAAGYAAYLTAVQAVFGLGCFAVAAVILRRKPHDGIALLVALMLVLIGAANPPNLVALAERFPLLAAPARLSQFLLNASVVLFLFLFPDGRFVPHRARLLVFLGIGTLLVEAVQPAGSLSEPSAVLGLLLLGGLGGGGIAQIYRYLRVSGPVQRQQTKWVVFGVATAVIGQLAFALLAPILPSVAPADLRATPYDATSVTGITLGFLLVPLAIGVAVLRYRLWDIDILINRTLVYGALTASVVGLYVLLVGGLGAVLQVGGNPVLALLATGLVAVLFQPLKDRLQRSVNHLMYGDRDTPYAALARLGQRLEATLAPAAVLPAIVQTVREALKLPHAAIAVPQGAGFAIAATSGPPAEASLRLPLVYQDEPVGELLLAPRAPGESFNPADRRLLDDLARQSGVAVHAVRLTADLQAARERLVTAREEERRRLRRDLHDGLGPQLASQTLTLAAARKLMAGDPAVVDALLADLMEQTQAAVVGIRRLLYDLRPPALDDLGLVGALREQAPRYEHAGLQVSIKVPWPLPALPAAVEVAAYRIAHEALTNVTRHARARTCTLRLALDEAPRTLCLEVRDDGRGLPAQARAGVGLTSMRERAEELGGTCRVDTWPGGGTRVLARLPLP